MRPLRAIAVVAIGVAFWAGWRGATVRDELAAEFTPAAVPQTTLSKLAPLASTSPPSQTPVVQPALRGTPEVMVYSYPTPPGGVAPGSPPPRLWRIRAKPQGRRPAARAEAEQPSTANNAVPPARATASPQARDAPPDMRAAAYEAASRGYADLRVGDRRGAAGAFAVALSLAPDHPNAKSWAREAKLLSKHWRAEVYTFLRQADGTRVPLPAASPVLGAGSTAATVGYTINPLSPRPIEVQARYTIPYRGFSSPDQSSAQASLGVAVRPFRKVPVTVAVERLFKLGPNARNDFQARLTGGTARRVRGIDLSMFGETGIVGKRPDMFAGAIFLAEKPFKLPGRIEASVGMGAWSAVQRTDTTTSRLDFGPTLRVKVPKSPLSLRVDYRVRVLGNARPGNGMALTVASGF